MTILSSSSGNTIEVIMALNSIDIGLVTFLKVFILSSWEILEKGGIFSRKIEKIIEIAAFSSLSYSDLVTSLYSEA